MIRARLTNLLCLMFVCVFSVFAQKQSRERIVFDDNWKFHLGHATDRKKDFNYGLSRLFAKMAENKGTCIRSDFDDKDWRLVNLPHDWVVELPFVYSTDGDNMNHGYKPVGGLYPQNSIGWYRKTFDLDAKKDTTRQLVITFDGIYRDSEVWVNGFYLGRHASGYTGVSYNITDFVRYDKSNTIVVRADATQSEGWYYEGAGIYRHVWLNFFDKLHFTPNGIFIHSQLSEDYTTATVSIETDVENNRPNDLNITVQTKIFDQKGNEIAKTGLLPNTINTGNKKLIKTQIQINNPALWSIETPHLYKAISVVYSEDKKIIDKVETKFGIRDVAFDADKGLFLNGKPLKIKGVCCHQDHAGLGTALPDYLQYYRIDLLKKMGANAYRPSHHPPTPELLEACDSLGMLVLDETRAVNSGSEYMKQWEDLILRDRNHPSVFMWSIGNEENEFQTLLEGKRITATMVAKQKLLDPYRTCTYGGNVEKILSGISETIPIRGFNYNLTGIDAYHKARPDQPVLGSEVGSTVTTRGVYQADKNRCYLTDFDENYPSWASTAEQWWTMAADREWFMGGFVWTGFDYRGEPTPHQWPNISSHFGIMDVCGFPKNIYYYYQSWWTDEDVLHIAPHWNWSGQEGKIIKVWVNSNAQKVELFLNGKSLGTKAMPINGHLNWDVKYTPGALKAVAYKNGRKIEKIVETTGKAKKIVLESSKNTIAADGYDALVVNVSVVDEKGREIPDINQLVKFSLSGNAQIIGVGNGDPSCHEADKCAPEQWQRSLFNGKCQLIIQSGKTKENITISALSDGLQKESIVISQK